MTESIVPTFEVTLRECAQILSLAPKLPIDYDQLVEQMIQIAGASNHLLIHVADITYLSPLHGSLAGSYWYSIVDQIAQLFIEGDVLTDLYSSDIHYLLWQSIKNLPIKIKDDKTGVIHELHDVEHRRALKHKLIAFEFK
jgi:hypothetical protein